MDRQLARCFELDFDAVYHYDAREHRLESLGVPFSIIQTRETGAYHGLVAGHVLRSHGKGSKVYDKMSWMF